MESTNVRVTGTMLLNQDYNNSNICIWGYPQEVSYCLFLFLSIVHIATLIELLSGFWQWKRV